MPRARKKEFYEVVKQFTVFAFIDRNNTQCFVWKTSNKNLKAVFEVHYLLRNVRTKNMFEEGRALKRVPIMYVLEIIESTEAIAFKHCIAWTKYFMEQGLTSLNNEIHKGYTEQLDEITQPIYEEIHGKRLCDVMDKEHQLFADYGTIRQKRTEQQTRQIAITVSPKEYEKVQINAEKLGMTPTAYLKEMAVNGKVYREDYNFFLAYKDSLRDIERQLKSILTSVYNTEKYDPADKENLQKLCVQVGEIHRDAMRIFNKRKYGKRTKRK